MQVTRRDDDRSAVRRRPDHADTGLQLRRRRVRRHGAVVLTCVAYATAKLQWPRVSTAGARDVEGAAEDLRGQCVEVEMFRLLDVVVRPEDEAQLESDVDRARLRRHV